MSILNLSIYVCRCVCVCVHAVQCTSAVTIWCDYLVALNISCPGQTVFLKAVHLAPFMHEFSYFGVVSMCNISTSS